MSASDFNQLDRDMTGFNMVTTLGSAWLGGFGAGLGRGAGILDTPSLTSYGPPGGITSHGILQIEEHLSRGGELSGAMDDPANQAMIGRLRAGSTTTQDVNFYNHELREKYLMDRGMGYAEAHSVALRWQGIPHVPGYESQLFHPSVIQQMPEYFNPAAHPK